MNKLSIIIIAFLMLTFYGCDEFLDVNTNPDKAVTVTPEKELPVIVFYAAQLNYDHAEYGTYLSQALTTAGRSQTGSTAYRSGWEFLSMNRHPQWRRHYYDLGVNINEMIKLAEKEKSYNFILIGRSIRLMSTLFTTDLFGDMPLSKAYTSIAPLYDTQEQVYDWMIKEADDLLALYENKEWTEASTNKRLTATEDRIYAGNLTHWKLFTQAIKARILLRKLPNWDNTPASCDAIIAAVDKALTADWVEPNYVYSGGSGEKNNPWGSAKPVINSWESRANDLDKAIPSEFFLVDMMGLYATSQGLKAGDAEDPRLTRYMAKRAGPTTGNDTGTKYRYLKNNIGMDVSYKETNYPDLYASTNILTQNTGYVSLMLTEELLLMKAEALYWKGNKQEALDVMKAAVDKSLERHGATSDNIAIYKGVYIAKNASATEKRYQELSVTLGAKYFPTVDKFTIGHIMRQKYVAMYLQPEQWNDMRRYQYSNSKNGKMYDGTVIYPNLKRPFNLYEPYWVTPQAVAEEHWIQRLNYDPETEEKYNRSELERHGAYRNPDWLKKPMIWAVYDGAHK